LTSKRTAAVDDERPAVFKLRDAYQAGDLWGFVDALVDSGGDVHPADPLRRLRAMVRDRAQLDATAFADDVLQHGLELVGYLAIRTQILLERAMLQHDRNLLSGYLHSPLPETVTERLLPRLTQMQRHLAEMLEMQASTLRKRELAAAKRRENRQPIQTTPDGPQETKACKSGEAEEPLAEVCQRSTAKQVILNGSRT